MPNNEKRVKFNLTAKPSDVEFWREIAETYCLQSVSAAIAFITNDFRQQQKMRQRAAKLQMGVK